MALNLTNFDSALKQHYTDDRVLNMVYADNPLLAMIPKMEKFGGRNLPLPVIYGNPQGRSATFGDAQDNKGNSRLEDFVLTRVRNYSLADIDNETLKASEGNEDAFLEAAITEIDGALQAISRNLAIAMYRRSGGSMGVVGSYTGSASTFTLSDINDITNFEVGMELEADTVNGGGTLHSGTASVTAVNRTTGVVTSDSAWDSQITGFAANDHIFQEGDYDLQMSGLLDWLPTTAPGATTFFGVNRSVDVTRLGGVRYDGSSDPIEEAVIEGISQCAREGGRPDYMFMSFDKYSALEKALGVRVRYDNIEVPAAEIGFRGIVVSGPRGQVRIIPDQNCPSSQAFALQMDTWKLYSLGPAPQIIETDGLRVLRNATSDSVEVRTGYYAQLGCRAPGFSLNLTLP